MSGISGSSPSATPVPPPWDDTSASSVHGAPSAPTDGVDDARWEPEPRLSSDFAGSDDLQAVFRGEKELVRGEKGDAVRLVQQQLYRTGLAVRGGFDGDFGRGTESAIAAFQRSVGQDPTGRLTQETLIALDDAELKRVIPAPSPLTGSPASYLRNDTEREAYRFIERTLWTGASWRRGLDAAVTDDDTKAVLDRLDTLGSASYSRVLHAMAATKVDEPRSPTVLDKLIRRGTSQAFHVRLSARFGQQMIDKLGNAPIPDKKILSHISPDTVDRLRSWASWEKLVNLFS